jgi:hypothetical protein
MKSRNVVGSTNDSPGLDAELSDPWMVTERMMKSRTGI